MIIKERPVITWLLNPDGPDENEYLVKARLSNKANEDALNDELVYLNEIRKKKPHFGLPELVMPSFEHIMVKSAPAFGKVRKKLFQEFGETDECGILLYRNNSTIVYGFGEGKLFAWYFVEKQDKSVFTFALTAEVFDDFTRIECNESVLMDNALFAGSKDERLTMLLKLVDALFVYVAVKKYIKVETIVIPQGTFTEIDDTPLQYVEKKKVVNKLGQEVIVMDSKWFRKIINDNDIPVRGFFRMQNKKNDGGEWYKELIFVDPFVRHGYHRDAKIEYERPDNENET